MSPRFSRGVRAAGWFLPLVPIALAAFISNGLVSRPLSRGTDGNVPSFLAALSHRTVPRVGVPNLLADVALAASGPSERRQEDVAGGITTGFPICFGTVTRLSTPGSWFRTWPEG
jgi:hypothetical protein